MICVFFPITRERCFFFFSVHKRIVVEMAYKLAWVKMKEMMKNVYAELLIEVCLSFAVFQ